MPAVRFDIRRFGDYILNPESPGPRHWGNTVSPELRIPVVAEEA
jgi:hypothetical protein